nr:CopG family transcriptional regulator [Ramlibacter algicola]
MTVLLDPSRKQAFEQACHANDMTPSQVLRHLIRDYVTSGGRSLSPSVRPITVQPAREDDASAAPQRRAARRTATRN